MPLYAREAFQITLESLFHFSKIARAFQHVPQPIGTNILKSCERIENKLNQLEKWNQSADTLSVFENSIEIQKLFEYSA